MTVRYSWQTAGVVGQPGKTIKIGFRKEILSSVRMFRSIYVRSINDVKNGTKIARILSEYRGMDEQLNLYKFSPIGDPQSVNGILGWIMAPIRCSHCRKPVTYIEGMAHCDRCDRIAGEFV